MLDLPELKITQPSDTRWLAHERCVKAVKASYGAIVAAIDNNHENAHEPEALGQQYTVVAMYMLDYVHPQVAKLSKTLQTEQLDLSVIVNATLHTLDDSVSPSANWVLERLDECKHLEEAAGITVTQAAITTFQEEVAKPFITHIKENISSRFASSSKIVSAFNVFDPRKAPNADSTDFPRYGQEAIGTLPTHYGVEKPTETMLRKLIIRDTVITSDVTTEWKTYRQLVVNKPESSMKLQLKELASNDMLKTMFPNLSKLATICLSIPVQQRQLKEASLK